jgi:hypothetical protein
VTRFWIGDERDLGARWEASTSRGRPSDVEVRTRCTKHANGTDALIDWQQALRTNTMQGW